MTNEVGTKAKILRAAADVIRAKGLGKATTRAIARAAGLSEGALYKHFDSKLDMFLSLLRSSPSDFVTLVMSLPERAGQGSVTGNLQDLAERALEFYQRSLPMGSSLFAEPELLARNREELRQRRAGPQLANEALADYLRRERELGRVRQEVDVNVVADLLLGACFQRAYLAQFIGPEMNEADIEAYAAGVVRALTPAL
ncbi:MAG TPA: TetR family transcriptional regulator [Trueperaceae bacterium]|nr:TetR family transcriptional regulator [Trueperaceae bacterium]